MFLAIILIIGLAMFIIPVLIFLARFIIDLFEESPLLGTSVLGLIIIFVCCWFIPV